jgi:hypothetical protein
MKLYAALLVTTVALLAAGCGRGSTKTETAVVTVTNVSTVTAPAPAAADHDYARFQLPSHNIGCGVDSGALRCDILSGLMPEPSQACELDWTGVVLDVERAAQPECAGDTVFDGSAPVLDYGESWAREGISCLSTREGLDCETPAGHGFHLARQAWAVF